MFLFPPGYVVASSKGVPSPPEVLAGLNVEALIPALPIPPSYENDIEKPLQVAQAHEKIVADDLAAANAKAAEQALAASQVTQTVEPTPATVAIVYSGDNYDFGSCAWYVASLITVPSSMGNAANWATGLVAAGWHEGAPTVGAIAQTSAGEFGHVAIVTAVVGDTVTVTEMNATAGWDAIDLRTVPVSAFVYLTK